MPKPKKPTVTAKQVGKAVADFEGSKDDTRGMLDADELAVLSALMASSWSTAEKFTSVPWVAESCWKTSN